ncbi:DUF4129 domain-containing protein [Halobellus sp. GM3]|uniref:DUF4129 domain-containing protein n=1 Tax=Halobellus sp. GM3 TaxID=3458410 RepID=UPI00403D6151
MRRQRAFALVVVACCLLILTSMSASLESTVSGTPDDAINPDFASLPLSVEEASELKEAYQSGQKAQDGDPSDQSRSEDGSGDENRNQRRADGSETDESAASSVDPRSEQSGPTGVDRSQNEEGNVPGLPDQGLLAMLYDLLLALLGALRAALPALLLLVAVILVVHRRDRLLAWLETRLERLLSTEGGTTADAAPPPAFRSPSNQVERAWLELLSRSGVDPEPSATPRECVEMLTRAGFDGDAVRELVTLFEEVRYAEAPVTDDRVERARRCLRRSRSREAGE